MAKLYDPDKPFFACMKIKVNPKWSEGVSWEYHTLLNSLNLNCSVNGGSNSNAKEAEDKAQAFIQKNGIQDLFTPSHWKRT